MLFYTVPYLDDLSSACIISFRLPSKKNGTQNKPRQILQLLLKW